MQFDYTTLEESFKKLPEEVQYALTSPKISQDIQTIAQKNGLMLDQMEILYDITTYVMLGLLPSNKFTSTLAKELNVSEKQAGLITSQISNEVFVNIKELMREYEAKNQSTYVTSLGNTQMNANTYPQSFKPINTSSTTQQPLSPVTESPHADLEKAGGFTIEVAGNPLPNIEKPKPQPVELPKTQQPLSPNPPIVETKNETISQSFQPTNYYNFKNNQEIKTGIEDKKDEEIKKEIENKPENKEKEISIMEEKTIVPGKIVFKHVPDIEIKKQEIETKIKDEEQKMKVEVENKETIKPVEKTELIQDTEPKNSEIQVKEIVKPIETIESIEVVQTPESQKPLANYLVSKMNDKSTIPDNLPLVEETPTPTETMKETVVPPVANEGKVTTTPKPIIESKPRAFDPYREIPS